MIDAILLAAGSSRRMGKKNKLLLSYEDQAIIEHMVEQILNSSVHKVIAVVGYEYQKMVKILGKYPVEIVYNASYASGQTSSIQAAMDLISSTSQGFMVCLGDMPLLQTGDYTFVIDAFNKLMDHFERPITRPEYNNKIGNPVIFHSSYKTEILNCTSPENCREVIARNKNNYHPTEVNHLKYFFDIDAPEDYERYIRANK